VEGGSKPIYRSRSGKKGWGYGAQCYPMGRDQVIMEKDSRKRDGARIFSLYAGLHREIIYVYRWLYGARTVYS
jgi:hypothetical protein